MAGIDIPGLPARAMARSTPQDERDLLIAKALDEYWTAERMESATPMDTPIFEADTAAPLAPQMSRTGIEPEQTSSLPTLPTESNLVGPRTVTNWSATNGRLIFDKPDGTSGYCSASALNSSSKRLIVTAGHCVHTGKGGGWHKNLIFVPQYDSGNAPYGKWTAYYLRTSNDWTQYGESSLTQASKPGFLKDVGFVTLNAGGTSKKRIVDAVGGHGFSYNGGLTFNADIFGYPKNLSGGAKMYACSRNTLADLYYQPRLNVGGCNFGGGSSGGPWLDKYSNASGLGYVRSVTSTFSSSNGVNGGAYFDDSTNAMFTAANNDW